jgi:hypothetical protein
LGHEWVIMAKGLLQDGQRALIERLCILVLGTFMQIEPCLIEKQGSLFKLKAKFFSENIEPGAPMPY